MAKILFILFIFLLTSKVSSQEYVKIHTKAIVVDMHNDAIERHLRGQSIEIRSKRGHVDLFRLRDGGLDISFFALWPDIRKYQPDNMFNQTVRMLDSLTDIISRNSDRVNLIENPDDIEIALKNDKIAIGIGIEDGAALEGNLEKLEYFYKRGVRYITLTWNYSNEIATSSRDEICAVAANFGGLTEFGIQVIHRMNELGMMIDVSHSGIETFCDVIKTSSKPVIASHSGVYTICPHHRNLNDNQIRKLAQNGGVLFINFSPIFLKKGFGKTYARARKMADAIEDSIKAGIYNKPFDRPAFIHSHIDPIYPGVKDVVDHIEYVIHLVGDDYVGLGSDYDGIPLTPAGLSDISKMPNITKELIRRGYKQKAIEKILGGNFIRVFKTVCDTVTAQ